MLFNSLHFLLFFPIVCVVYYLIPWNKIRVYFLLVASYYFYMCWKPAFGIVLFCCTLLAYVIAFLLNSSYFTDKRLSRKILLGSGIVLNVSLLFFYKYLNLLGEIISCIMHYVGISVTIPYIELLAPVGISFFVFLIIAYLVDVYKKSIPFESNLSVFALFVCFFPKLIQGPIERGKELLPQFHQKVSFSYMNVSEGVKMMIWGYFMKLCVADRLGMYVDAVYNNYSYHNGTSLWLASLFYSIQIYSDFAGYSLIAIGTGRILGYKLMTNFNRPYFAISITDFWRRWHISLSTWLRDYIYIPLGGNRCGKIRSYYNILVTFLISGVWHGANWTFIFWGGLHGIFQIVEKTLGIAKVDIKSLSRASFWGRIFITFMLVNFAWIFFRIPSINDAKQIIIRIFTTSGMPFMDSMVLSSGIMSMLILFLKDFKDEFFQNSGILNYYSLHSKSLLMRYILFSLLVGYILTFGVLESGQFIYFQF